MDDMTQTGTTLDRVAEAAARLLDAATSQEPCPPVRDLIGSDDLQAAYAVQHRNAEARLAAGATVVGRKIGLTSPAVQAQLSVDQPDFGILFADMAYPHIADVPGDAVLQPRVEAEVAFVLKADLADGIWTMHRSVPRSTTSLLHWKCAAAGSAAGTSRSVAPSRTTRLPAPTSSAARRRRCRSSSPAMSR